MNIEIQPGTECLYRATYIIPEREIKEAKLDEVKITEIAKREVFLHLVDKIMGKHKIEVKETHDPQMDCRVFSLSVYVFGLDELRNFIIEIQKLTRKIQNHDR
jgi:hypothetical protein